MILNIEKLTTAVMAAVTRPNEDRQITWAYVLSSISKIAKITAKVINSIQAEEPLTIEFTDEDSRSLDDDRLVSEIVADLRADIPK